MRLQGAQDLYPNLKPLEKHKRINSLPYSFNKFVSKSSTLLVLRDKGEPRQGYLCFAAAHILAWCESEKRK